MKLFQEVKYINLAHRTDRNAHCLAEFENLGIVAERFDAINTGSITGCNLSHIQLLENATGNILIFEDDVWFSEYFTSEIDQILADLPSDWQIFYLGANHRTPPKPIKGNLAKAIEPYTTHAYAVNGNFTKQLAEILKADGGAIDAVYANAIHRGDIIAYCCNPSLAYQLPNHSDIEGRWMSYEFMVALRDNVKLFGFLSPS